MIAVFVLYMNVFCHILSRIVQDDTVMHVVPKAHFHLEYDSVTVKITLISQAHITQSHKSMIFQVTD